ncbi:MAG: FtsX-like permease family protein [Thermoanaerobaculia bacterium]|nr:FtsX-like permease family protein [Thermoanaerobaculia bacterium]
MSGLLRRASRRHFTRHPWQLGLAVLGVALGVAVVVSVDLANQSALSAFRASSERVTGRATHQIVGGSVGVPEETYRRLRRDLGVRAAAPVVEGWVVSGSGRVFQLLGVDPFAESAFRGYVGLRGEGLDLGAFLTRPGAVVVSAAAARDLGVGIGDRLEATAAGRPRTLEVVGTFAREASDARAPGLDDLMLADVATAQELLESVGSLSRIDLLAPDTPTGRELRRRVAAALPGGVELVAADARTETAAQMTRAFRINLQALSLLALLCGAFLIYNTITFAVVQRRRLFGILRAVGVTRRQLARLILGEALVVSLAGSVFGLALGAFLGRILVRLVTRTINDLYFVLTVREVTLPAGSLLEGLALGVGVSLLAALAPAGEALSAEAGSALDRAELESRVHRLLPWVSAGGLLLGAAGAALLLLPGAGLGLAFFGLFAVLLGFALLTPAAVVALMALLTPLAGLLFGRLGRMAARGVVTALSRTGVAVAALMMAVAVTVGVDLMIDSFRGTVDRWLSYSLPADLYVSAGVRPVGRYAGAGPGIEPAALARVAALPGVEAVNSVRQVEVESPRGPLRLLAYDLDARGREAFSFAAGEAERAWTAFDDGAVLVSEPLAFRAGLGPGDRIELSTFDGVRSFEVAGVTYDYASERGAVMMEGRRYRELWDDPQRTALSVYAPPGADLRQLAGEVRRSIGPDRQLRVRSNREIREESLRVFDRTFLVTGVLRLLAVVVAFVGVLSALTALQLERERELGVLRATGLTPGQLWRLVTAQTGLMGLAAGLLSIPAGVAMATIMVRVINRRSFGWTLELGVTPAALASAVLLAVGAALVAGLYPAFKMSRTSPAEALRAE